MNYCEWCEAPLENPHQVHNKRFCSVKCRRLAETHQRRLAGFMQEKSRTRPWGDPLISEALKAWR